MLHIDPTEVNASLPARIAYLQSFLHFDPEADGTLIHACKPVLAPLVTDIVDAVYDHLLKYDITAAAFARAQTEDQTCVGVNEIHRDHANIKVRKDFLKGYLVRLASNTDYTPSSKFWEYLDRVGKAHTGAMSMKHRGNKPPLFVDYREVNLLLGWCENAVIEIVMKVESLDLETKVKIVKALNAYWWIQNDLFARHYIPERPAVVEEGVAEEEVKVEGSDGWLWGTLRWGSK